MRILLVANTLPPADLSGVGEQVLQLAAGLRRLGHEVRVLGRGGDGARGPKLLFPLLVVPAVWKALRRWQPDVIQVHESDGALAALLISTLAPLQPVPPRLVALLQVSYLEEMRAVRALRAQGLVLGRPGAVEWVFRLVKAPLQVALGWLTVAVADLVLAPSLATARELERDYGAERVTVVPNVMGGREVEPVPLVGEDRGEDFLLFVGRLRIRKGVEVLLQGMQTVWRELPEQTLVIAGDGEHRRALERAAGRLGAGRRVRFVGRRSAGEVRSLLAAARALVVPSIYEGMPLVVLEAMEAGTPVVASRVSGLPEVVIAGETGWLVPPEDPAALGEALLEACRGRVEAGRRGAAGRRRLESHFRPESAASSWEQALVGEIRAAEFAAAGDHGPSGGEEAWS